MTNIALNACLAFSINTTKTSQGAHAEKLKNKIMHITPSSWTEEKTRESRSAFINIVYQRGQQMDWFGRKTHVDKVMGK